MRAAGLVLLGTALFAGGASALVGCGGACGFAAWGPTLAEVLRRWA